MLNSPDLWDDSVVHLLNPGDPVDVVRGPVAGVDDEVGQEGKDDVLKTIRNGGKGSGKLAQVSGLGKVNVLGLGKSYLSIEPLHVRVSDDQKLRLSHLAKLEDETELNP